MFSYRKTVGNFAICSPVSFRNDLVKNSKIAVEHLQGPDVFIVSRLLYINRVQRSNIDSGGMRGEVDIEPVNLCFEG